VALSKRRAGFTLIEILVSLVLVGVLILITSSLILPLRITRASSVETQAVAFAQSYIELVKSRWQVATAYDAAANTTGDLLPVVDSTSTADIRIPDGWVFEVDKSDWKVTDTIRTLKITVKPKDTTSTTGWVVLTTRITRPS
jgi:prepilin-type N-terminal cleavage/methylation domain-containing protein